MEEEDEKIAIYSYRGDDFRLDNGTRNALRSECGMFTISKDALEEPEIRVERGRISKHRKGYLEKRVPHIPDIIHHIRTGEITIDVLCGVDRLERDEHPEKECPSPIAYTLLVRLFVWYMAEGSLPKEDAF